MLEASATTLYDSSFWNKRRSTAAQSASVCVPFLNDILEPTSVVDIGCGQGHWLVEFQRLGVQDVFGVDGQYVAEQENLLIPETRFLARDLRLPLVFERTFSLALCLEVAEHIPRQSARQLVADLTRCASLVVFSAAIPGQGGVGHVNEQWPWYWERLFREFGFVQLDIIRPLIWKNTAIAQWYRQNMFVYASQSECSAFVAEHQQESDSLTLVSRETLEKLATPSLLTRAIRKAGRLSGLWNSPTA